MRYFGKDGPQCMPPEAEINSNGELLRHYGRAFLFGRVPRGVSLWLGAGVMLIVLLLGAYSIGNVQPGFRVCRDSADAVAIRR